MRVLDIELEVCTCHLDLGPNVKEPRGVESRGSLSVSYAHETTWLGLIQALTSPSPSTYAFAARRVRKSSSTVIPSILTR